MAEEMGEVLDPSMITITGERCWIRR